MACDVCGSSSTHKSIMGEFCQLHWDSDKPMRSAYFAFLAAGGLPADFNGSEEKRKAVQAMQSSKEAV